MGYELPAAIGAALASKNKRIICFAGDGSIMMNLQELQTIKTYSLNIIIILINNSGYLSIKQTHNNFFNNEIGASPKSSVGFPRFKDITNVFGIKSIEIKSKSKLDHFVRTFDELKGPMLIDMHVNSKQEFIPRLKSRIGDDGKFITPELDDMFPFLTKEKFPIYT